jgi:hypothetical protein
MNLELQPNPNEYRADADWLDGKPVGTRVEEMREWGNRTLKPNRNGRMVYRVMHWVDLDGNWYPVTYGCATFVEVALPDGKFRRLSEKELAGMVDRSWWKFAEETPEDRVAAAIRCRDALNVQARTIGE